MVEDDRGLETGGKVLRGKGDDQDQGRERGRGHHPGTGSSEGEANLGRETNSQVTFDTKLTFFLTNYATTPIIIIVALISNIIILCF